jgi:hypothetical protein
MVAGQGHQGRHQAGHELTRSVLILAQDAQ